MSPSRKEGKWGHKHGGKVVTMIMEQYTYRNENVRTNPISSNTNK